MAIAAENVSTRQSSVSRTAAMVSGTSVSRNRMTGIASASPAMAPSPASTRLSIRNCVINRPRPAPSAARTATSRRRTAPRDISRFARLTHAISRIAADAPSSTISDVCVLPASSSRNGVTTAERGRGRCCAVTRRLNAAIASRACSSVTPGLSRATQCTSCHPQFRQHPSGERRRHPDVDIARGHEVELARHHADHFVRIVVQRDRAAHHVRRSRRSAAATAHG